MAYDKVLKSALELSPVERAKLVEIVMQSLSQADPDIEQLWEREAVRRYKSYQRGDAIVRDMDDVLKKYRR